MTVDLTHQTVIVFLTNAAHLQNVNSSRGSGAVLAKVSVFCKLQFLSLCVCRKLLW